MAITITTPDQYGRFDVTVSGITIKGCKRQTGTSAKGPYDFIAFPQYLKRDKEGNTIKKKDGKDLYVADFEVSRELSADILAVVKGETAADIDGEIPF